MAETSGTPKQEIRLFYCYAREDKALRDELELHLSNLKRQYHLTNWHDREILPGEIWEQAIDAHLSTAHIILLLISSNFIASDYCYGKEMAKALEREKAGTCRVIPILLRPTDWEDAPFSHLQLLPTDARPVTSWADRDSAFWDIAKEIRKAIQELLIALTSKEKNTEEGNTPQQHEEALAAHDRAIRLNPNYPNAYFNKGLTLSHLKRYEEALAAYDQAIFLDPNLVSAYYGKGEVLDDMRRTNEADQAFKKARQIGYDSELISSQSAAPIIIENLPVATQKQPTQKPSKAPQGTPKKPNLAAMRLIDGSIDGGLPDGSTLPAEFVLWIGEKRMYLGKYVNGVALRYGNENSTWYTRCNDWQALNRWIAEVRSKEFAEYYGTTNPPTEEQRDYRPHAEVVAVGKPTSQ